MVDAVSEAAGRKTTNVNLNFMKRIIPFCLLLLAFMSFSHVALAQGQEVIGKVTDESGQPMPGVNVMVSGTHAGVVTDASGDYKIRVNNPENAVLEFAFLGMNTVSEKVGARRTIDVTLTQSAVSIESVVAIGYGTMRRADVTGSVTTVSAEELTKVPVTNVAQALAGRMAGVNVSMSEGDLNNSQISIRVRGGISLTQDNDPLYIIDGFPADATVFATLSASDIATIDVLKDASATAIYGARGANGVVLITTKGGREGKMSVAYEGYFGVKNITKKLDLLSIPEYAFLDYERNYGNGTAESLKSFTKKFGSFEQIPSFADRTGVDWQSEAFKTAYTRSHKVTVSGGNKDTKYNLSYSRQDEDGLIIMSALKKDVARIKVDTRMNNRFSVTGMATYTHQKTYGMGTSDGGVRFSKMCNFIQYLPTLGLLMPDEDFAKVVNLDRLDPGFLDEAGNTLQNPAASARAELDQKDLRILNVSGGFTYSILKGLDFKNSTSLLYRNQRNDVFYNSNSLTAHRSSIQGTIQSVESQTAQTSNTLSYQLNANKHNFNFLLGQEYVTTWNRWFKAGATKYPNDDIGLNDLSLGLPIVGTSYFSDDDKLLSFFGRVYYNFDNKYMLTATARYDGSTKFGVDNKWGFFPSASFAWRLSEERFIKEAGIFSDLKLRVGYGSAGNNRIPSYSSLAVWDSQSIPSNNGLVPGYYPRQMPNKELRWEANNTFNVGLDMGFFRNRLTINPEFYINRSKDLLLNATLPESSGYSSMMRNVGKTENRGIDLTVNSINIQRPNFTWTTSLTFSHNENKIIALSGENSFLESSNFGYPQKDFLIAVGQSMGQIYGYKTIGIYTEQDFDGWDPVEKRYNLKPGIPYREEKDRYPQPGYWKFENTNGDEDVDANGTPLINDKDRVVIGNTLPKFYGGINNTFTYRNFDLTVFLNFSYGNDVLNATKLGCSLFGQQNKNTFASNGSDHRWVTINPENGTRITDLETMGKVNTGKTVASIQDMNAAQTVIHSWAVEDGSFLRINNITLGYTFPVQKIRKTGIQSLRIYVSANNLHTFTKYSGYDPEVSTRNSTGLTPGVDWSAFPRAKTFVGGINITF